MASKRAAIADAIATALSGAASTFSISNFTISRKYVPIETLANLSTLTLTVVPFGPERRTPFDRGRVRKDFSIDIGIQKRFSQATDPGDPSGNVEIDALMDFAEQVAAYFEPQTGNAPLSIGSSPLKWVGCEIDQPYDLETMRTQRVFLSRVILSYFYI